MSVVGVASVKIVADVSQFSRDAAKAVKEATNGIEKSMAKTGASMTKSLTLPLVAVAGASSKLAMDFETSMTKITALVGIPREQVQAMEEDVRSLAVQFGSTAKESADALFFITSAGLRGTDAMEALEASLMASAIGLGEVATVADLATSAMNAYGPEVLSASGATDVLVAAVREGKLEASELSGAMGATLPLASAMGVKFNEVGAAFAAMSRTGTGASEASTQLNAILLSLQKPTVDAEKALAELGLSSAELRQQIREKGLLSALQTLKIAFDGNDVATARVFANSRALRGVLDMLGASADVTADIFNNMADVTGMTSDAMDVMAETSAFQLKQSIAEMKDQFLELGMAVLPVIMQAFQTLMPIVMSVFETFNALGDSTKTVLIIFGGIVAAVGPVLIVIAKLITAIKAIGTAIVAMQAKLALTPFGAIAIAIGLVVGAIAAIGISSANARREVKELAESIREIGAQQTARKTVEDLIKGNRNLADAVLDGRISINELTAAIEGGADSADDFGVKVRDLLLELGVSGNAATRTGMQIADLGKAFGGAVVEAEKLAAIDKLFVDETIGFQIQSLDELRAIAGQAAASIGVLTEEQQASAQASDDWIKRVQSAYDKGSETFLKFSEESKTSGVKFRDDLRQQVQDLIKWKADIARVGLLTSTEFALFLADMGDAVPLDDLLGDVDLLMDTFQEWQNLTEINTNTIQEDIAALARGVQNDSEIMIQSFNDLIQAINRLNQVGLPRILSPAELMVAPSGLPQTRRAMGGVITRPEIALIGEAGPEAVIPLSRPARAMQVMEEAGLLGVGGSQSFDITVVSPTPLRTAEDVVREFEALQYRIGAYT
jgi:TP901 family phage tail tape measure protein